MNWKIYGMPLAFCALCAVIITVAQVPSWVVYVVQYALGVVTTVLFMKAKVKPAP